MPRPSIFVLALAALSSTAAAQHRYPLRYVSPPDARAAVPLGTAFPILRSLSDGRLQMIDTVRHRATVLDRQLRVVSETSDSSHSRSGAVYLAETRSDSAPLVRVNAKTLVPETIARLRITTARIKLDTLSDGGLRWHATMEVLPTIDEYTVLSDGTIAVVRGADYHIDWYRADGTSMATRPMQIDWRRMTDSEKKVRVESARAAYEAAFSETLSASDAPSIDFVEPHTLPDFLPPVFVGGVKSDPRGNVWIVPTSSSYAGYAGFMYDVVNRHGQITERVRLPRNRVIAGFGDDGAIYMVAMEGNGYYLERTSLK